jgi:hypothetical protein
MSVGERGVGRQKAPEANPVKEPAFAVPSASELASINFVTRNMLKIVILSGRNSKRPYFLLQK